MVTGAPLVVEGTPFGSFSPDTFLNTYSEGIVSNKSSNSCLLFTDARCLNGTEGAPIYSYHQNRLVYLF